jgi:ElaB/YqjD/DUF883 family membrane-anchored ribosome-binding protein
VREEIEQTRAEMSETLDAIQDRLDPETLTENAKDRAQEVAEHAIEQAKEAAKEAAEHAIQKTKEAVLDAAGQARTALRAATVGKVEDMARNAGDTAGGWRHTAMETVKAHPLAASVAGLSLGWLFLNRSSGSSPASRRRWEDADYRGDRGYGDTRSMYGTTTGTYAAPRSGGMGEQVQDAQHATGQVVGRVQDKAGEMLGQAQEVTGQAVGQVQETAGQVVGQVQDTAGQVVDQVQEQASRAQSFLQRQLEENPLAVGAAAVAIGAALGATLGTTPREDRLMGDLRDRLMGRAQAVTQETMEKVEHVVDRVTDEAKDVASKEARDQGLVPDATR